MGLVGSYTWNVFRFEPMAQVYALREHENAYTDSLGTLQTDRDFETGRASGGEKISYPVSLTGAVALAPYAGLFADYYFSRDDGQATFPTTVPLLQGWSARVTGGLAIGFGNTAQLSAGGEYGGLGSDTHIWMWRLRANVLF